MSYTRNLLNITTTIALVMVMVLPIYITYSVIEGYYSHQAALTSKDTSPTNYTKTATPQKTSPSILLTQKNPLKIVIIDSGLNRIDGDGIQICEGEHSQMDFTGTGLTDNFGHGTNIANIIATKLKGFNYCFYIFKAFDVKNKFDSIVSLVRALEWTNYVRPFVVNVSAGGAQSNSREFLIVEEILEHGIQIDAAAGNNATELSDKACNYFPACYDTRINVVGNLNLRSSNYGPRVRFWEDGNNVTAGGYTMSGTSQATALFTGNMVKKVLESRYEK